MKHGVTLTAKSECAILHKTAFTPDTNKKSRGSPKPPSDLTVFLEGFTELIESYYIHRCIMGKDTNKNKPKKDAQDSIWEGSKHKPSVVFRMPQPPGIHM